MAVWTVWIRKGVQNVSWMAAADWNPARALQGQHGRLHDLRAGISRNCCWQYHQEHQEDGQHAGQLRILVLHRFIFQQEAFNYPHYGYAVSQRSEESWGLSDVCSMW